MSSDKDPARVIAGLKSTIHNPHTSDEAKERAADRLESMGSSTQERETRFEPSSNKPSDELSNRQAGGYKATLHSDRTSDKAKDHAREILEAAGYPVRPPDSTEEDHQTRVLAGYKAAIHNPRVSEEAKAHARQVLKDYGEE